MDTVIKLTWLRFRLKGQSQIQFQLIGSQLCFQSVILPHSLHIGVFLRFVAFIHRLPWRTPVLVLAHLRLSTLCHVDECNQISMTGCHQRATPEEARGYRSRIEIWGWLHKAMTFMWCPTVSCICMKGGREETSVKRPLSLIAVSFLRGLVLRSLFLYSCLWSSTSDSTPVQIPKCF